MLYEKDNTNETPMEKRKKGDTSRITMFHLTIFPIPFPPLQVFSFFALSVLHRKKC